MLFRSDLMLGLRAERNNMKDAIRYKVTVTAVVERTETKGREWKPTTAEKDAPYAYTPEYEGKTLREVTVLEQTIEGQELDMRALVAVLNNLPVPPRVTVERA